MARRSLLTNGYFWAGVAGIVAVGALLLVLLDAAIMPAYTRQGASVQVPAVERQGFEDAEAVLQRAGLKVERVMRRYDPGRRRGEVIEQEPRAGTVVKPGRLVYLTVNEGVQPRVRVPQLVGVSLREARTRLEALGLRISEERPDTIPSPYKNTITQQAPSAGVQVPPSTGVTLWYSTGPSDEMVTVPDVTGKTVAMARAELLAHQLRALVVDARGPDAESQLVKRQSREPGTRVRGGFEVRLFVTADTTTVAPPPAQ